MSIKTLLLVGALSFPLVACGNTTQERALSGGAIGAGAGAVGSSITGGSAVTGALIGGAAGAGVGALTDESDINLGEPLWDR